jgi:hypothetical protein
MTTTNYSRELCDICGIEPIQRCKHFTGKEKCLMNIPHNACICECVEQGWVYPDFEKPENFVKLLNILYKLGINQDCDFNLASMSFTQDDYSVTGDSFEDIWLKCLLLELDKSNPDTFDSKFSEMVKQAIKSEEWIYG